MKNMLDDFAARFKDYLQNDFLIASAFLDPRYTRQTETLLNQQFSDFVPKIVELFCGQSEQSINETVEQNDANASSQISTLNEEFNFWDDDYSTATGLGNATENPEDDLVVNKFKFIFYVLFSWI